MFSILAILLTFSVQAQSVQDILNGKSEQKAAFLTFATGFEVRAPEETVRALVNLRDIDKLPINGIWVETQHIRFGPSDVQTLISLARARGFYTMLRLPSHRREDIQGYAGTGVDGLVFPVVERTDQVVEAMSNSFYSAFREIGFEPDTGNLRRLSDADLAAIDQRKIVAFMIESVTGVSRIQELAKAAAEMCVRYGIRRNQVVFWVGPYDGKTHWRRLHGLGQLEPGEQAANADEWWAGAIQRVSEVVGAHGFVLGGHMPTAKAGAQMQQNQGFRIFTIPGIADSFGNPRVPSTGGLFLQADKADLEVLLGKDCAAGLKP